MALDPVAVQSLHQWQCRGATAPLRYARGAEDPDGGHDTVLARYDRSGQAGAGVYFRNPGECGRRDVEGVDGALLLYLDRRRQVRRLVRHDGHSQAVLPLLGHMRLWVPLRHPPRRAVRLGGDPKPDRQTRPLRP